MRQGVAAEAQQGHGGGDGGPGCNKGHRSNSRWPLLLLSALGAIRTRDLWLRRPTLYPTELRAHETTSGRRISRVLSPGARRESRARGADHFSRTAVASRLQQPTRGSRGLATTLARAAPRPCLALLRVGFTMPLLLPGARWALTPPFHPCLCPCGPSAVCSLLHFPSACAARPLAGTLPCGARTFLDRHMTGRDPHCLPLCQTAQPARARQDSNL